MKKYLIIILSILMSLALGCSQPAPPGEKDPHLLREEALKANNRVSAWAWNPARSLLAFVEEEQEGALRIWSLEKEAPEAWAQVPLGIGQLTWSPQGDRLWAGQTGEEANRIWIYGLEQAEPLAGPIETRGWPAWHPEGTHLAYGHDWVFETYPWGLLEVLDLEQGEVRLFWKTYQARYEVTQWDGDLVLHYLFTDQTGQTQSQQAPYIFPTLGGIGLGDGQSQVEALWGKADEETDWGTELLNYPEPVKMLYYERGLQVVLTQETQKVLEVSATSPDFKTNLDVGPGDGSALVFERYRGRYIEPETIHGGVVPGLFKTEGGSALYFRFDLKDQESPQDIGPEHQVIQVSLTMPELMDDSF